MKKIIFLLFLFSFTNILFAIQIKDNGQVFLEEKEGKKYYYRCIDIFTGNVDYRVNILFYEFENKIFINSIGLLGGLPGKLFSKRGWCQNAFIDVLVDDKSCFQFPGKIQIFESGINCSYETDKGEIKMIFLAENQSDKIFLELQVPPNFSNKMKILLTAYPGDFNKGKYELNDRWIATFKREIQNQGEVNLDKIKEIFLEKDEAWIYYYDKKNNPDGNPALSTCALLYNPNEMEKIGVKIGNYAIRTILYGKEQISSFHIILFEFPGKDYNKCLEYMKELSVKFD